MRTTLLGTLATLSAALLLAACGSSGNGSPSSCQCSGGCDVLGNCLTDNVNNNSGSGPLTCAMTDKPVGTSTAAQLGEQVVTLGHHTVGDTVAFTVPANTVSLTIVEQAVNAPDYVTYKGSPLDNSAEPSQITDPSGNVVFDDLNQPGDATGIENSKLFFASSSPATGTVTLPNSTGGIALVNGGLPSGDWHAVVSDIAYQCTKFSNCTGGKTDSVYDVTVILKTATGGAIPTAGTLDVAFYFVATSASGQALSAATASSDQDVKRMVQSLGKILANGGLTLGRVSYTDLPSDVQAQYATGVDVDPTGACAPISQLLKYAAPGNTMNIFLVPSFQASGLAPGNQVVGIDGTIPGVSTIGGTVASGAAVAVVDLRKGRPSCTGNNVVYPNATGNCGADITAYIVAHETGHFLGLYHVTEHDGESFDPLAGTPRCTCSACAPAAERSTCGTGSSPYEVQVGDCLASSGTDCGGGNNLMFWLLDQGAQGVLLPEQQSVIHANPLVQ